MHHIHSGNLTITHKLDHAQFAALVNILTALIQSLGSTEDPEEVKNLTARLKASADALNAAVDQPTLNP